jgi:hypothetical protein
LASLKTATVKKLRFRPLCFGGQGPAIYWKTIVSNVVYETATCLKKHDRCSPFFVDWARKLAQRGDGRLIAYSVAGGYLKIFESQQSLAWTQRLLARYHLKIKAKPCHLTTKIRPRSRRYQRQPAGP